MNSVARCKLSLSVLMSLIMIAAAAAFAHAGSSRYAQKVVSLAPSVTETLFALGFGNVLVGVTTHCDYPEEALKIPKIGGFTSPSLEVIIAKQPDLIIGVSSATDPMKARELERLGLKVVLISLASVRDILTSIRSIAGLLGNPGAGEQLAQRITKQFESVKRRIGTVPPRRTLLAVGSRPLVAVGGKNFIDELITAAGGENIAGSAAQPWLNLPDEYIVAKAPQVIIEAGMGSDRSAAAKRWADLKSIPAVTQQRVYSYPSDKILRPGPRIGEGLEEIARLVHPECFAEAKPGSKLGSHCESSRP
jgi:iron complex transport system substrate-binding protein